MTIKLISSLSSEIFYHFWQLSRGFKVYFWCASRPKGWRILKIRQSKVTKSAREIQSGVEAKMKSIPEKLFFDISQSKIPWNFFAKQPSCKLVFIFALAYHKNSDWFKLQRGGRGGKGHKNIGINFAENAWILVWIPFSGKIKSLKKL